MRQIVEMTHNAQEAYFKTVMVYASTGTVLLLNKFWLINYT